MMARGDTGKTINIQVKSTYTGYDWLVSDKLFDPNKNFVVAFVRLGKDDTKQPELYFLSGAKANDLITHKYKKHSPRVSRSDIQEACADHDFELIYHLLE